MTAGKSMEAANEPAFHDMEALLTDAANRAARYLGQLDSRRVCADPAAVDVLRDRVNAPLPENAVEPSAMLDFLDRFGSPATVASAGGRYFGFVTGGTLPASLGAQFLTAAWDQNCFSYVSSPAASVFEEAALRLIGDALRLPVGAGAFVTGATMANFTCLAAARNTVLYRAGWDVDRDGLFGAPPITVIVGEECHGTLFKVLSMLGLGRDRVMVVPADHQGRLLAEQLPEVDGPVILCLQAGNVNSGAFDPAAAAVAWAEARQAWVHVDGAFGLWARVSTMQTDLAAGLERADSWATDAHKWLNVPYDCGAALVRDRSALARGMSVTGAYLHPSDQRDAIDYTPDSSRRARGIDVWVALNALGRSGLAALIDRHCRQAADMAILLREAGIEVMNDVVLNQVVVRFGDDERTRQVIAAIQHDGTCWCGGTVWRGHAAMRISISGWATTAADIRCSAAKIIEINQANSSPN